MSCVQEDGQRQSLPTFAFMMDRVIAFIYFLSPRRPSRPFSSSLSLVVVVENQETGWKQRPCIDAMVSQHTGPDRVESSSRSSLIVSCAVRALASPRSTRQRNSVLFRPTLYISFDDIFNPSNQTSFQPILLMTTNDGLIFFLFLDNVAILIHQPGRNRFPMTKSLASLLRPIAPSIAATWPRALPKRPCRRFLAPTAKYRRFASSKIKAMPLSGELSTTRSSCFLFLLLNALAILIDR